MSLFITFEGAEATGKSSIISAVGEYLTATNRPFIITREPGGTPLAEAIRDLLFAADNASVPNIKTELLLMFAARRDHIDHVIVPALKAGKMVICDRYIDSSYVYQGLLGGVDKSIIDGLCADFIAPCYPDLRFFITAKAMNIQNRLSKRGLQNRYDSDKLADIHRLLTAFEEQALTSDKIITIENNHTLSDAVDKITPYFNMM